MKREHTLLAFIFCIAIIGVSYSSTSANVEQMQRDMEIFFPPEGISVGWKRASPTQFFTEENLYEHIDGAAESFFAYQFQLCGAATYEPEQGGEDFISVDIYDMNTPLNAYGMYRSELYPEAKFVDIGAEGYADSSSINFWKDKYYVKLLATREDESFLAANTAIAQAIADSIYGRYSMPYLAQLLPKEAIIEKSEKFVLDNVLGHEFLRNGMVARYQIGGQDKQFVLLDCQTEEDSRGTFSTFKRYEEKSDKNVADVAGLGDECFSAQDKYYQRIIVVRMNKFVIIALQVENEEATHALIKTFAPRISQMESVRPAQIFFNGKRLDISPPAQMKGQNIWLPVISFSQAIGASATVDEEKIVIRYNDKEIQLNRESSDIYIDDGTVFINWEQFLNLMQVQYSVDSEKNEILCTLKLDSIIERR
ncbi:hypothetical protein FJZ31_01970 [Candidatus Poribacteria bacterium]|nr:hypothetical protein [Candidatus Poribacteria bacterium]